MDESLEREASSGTDTRGNLLDRRRKSPHFRRFRLGLLLLLCAAVSVVVALGLSRSRGAARCPDGKEPLGHRCCWEGQDYSSGHCIGAASECTDPHEWVAGECRLIPKRIFIPGGTLRIAPNDWQAEGTVAARTVRVAPFMIDRTEVTSGSLPEPGLPLVGLDWAGAEATCRARGGRLPSVDEWTFAASGEAGRRFPWGQTGLVCRRAVFGLSTGPCGEAEHPGPDAVGSRPDGATPQGVLDLAGNVAEWAGNVEDHWAMGGSFQSVLASELKVWSRQRVAGGRADVGFRCVYDAPPAEDGSGKDSRRR